jgi:hypothetical protein
VDNKNIKETSEDPSPTESKINRMDSSVFLKWTKNGGTYPSGGDFFSFWLFSGRKIRVVSGSIYIKFSISDQPNLIPSLL